MPHTSTYQGKRVMIRLKSGEQVVGKFMGKKNRYVILDKWIVPIAMIKSFSIYKNKNT